MHTNYDVCGSRSLNITQLVTMSAAMRPPTHTECPRLFSVRRMHDSGENSPSESKMHSYIKKSISLKIHQKEILTKIHFSHHGSVFCFGSAREVGLAPLCIV